MPAKNARCIGMEAAHPRCIKTEEEGALSRYILAAIARLPPFQLKISG
jgi:hypothetical protein